MVFRVPPATGHEAASARPAWLWGLQWGRPALADPPAAHPGEELIYLDPHTTQPAVAAADRCPVPDESFHCQHPPGRMSITELDPSIAVVRPPCPPSALPCCCRREAPGSRNVTAVRLA